MNTSAEADLRIDKPDDGIALITLTRERVLNAIRRRTMAQLEEALLALESDEDTRVLLVTGQGRAFCAGADINEFGVLDPAEANGFIEQGQIVFSHLASSAIPTIAVLNGVALGGGNELALACDFRIAAESARFGQPEITLGHLPGWGGTQRLPRLIGRSAALRLLLGGQLIDADQALACGLVDAVEPDATCMDAAMSWARTLAAAAPVAVRGIKAAVDRGLANGIAEGSAGEREGFDECFRSDDHLEGFRAFAERREPTFHGR
jgi:enoyl-CoA hydratase